MYFHSFPNQSPGDGQACREKKWRKAGEIKEEAQQWLQNLAETGIKGKKVLSKVRGSRASVVSGTLSSGLQVSSNVKKGVFALQVFPSRKGRRACIYSECRNDSDVHRDTDGTTSLKRDFSKNCHCAYKV